MYPLKSLSSDFIKSIISDPSVYNLSIRVYVSIDDFGIPFAY